MTSEQEKQVEVIREQRASADILSHQTYDSQLKALLAIVDDLRKQPKQYTESEIIEAIGGGPSFWDYESGIVDCAKFLGALKE